MNVSGLIGIKSGLVNEGEGKGLCWSDHESDLALMCCVMGEELGTND